MHKLLFVIIFLFILGCAPVPEQEKEVTEIISHEQEAEQVAEAESWQAATLDGKVINGLYYPGTKEEGVILVHMLGRDRSSWENVPQDLNQKGFHVLAIDLRGHGDNLGKRFSQFTEEEWNTAITDVQAAHGFFTRKKVTTYLVGASIGANLVLKYAATDDSILKVILLSPGLEYRGVEIGKASKEYKGSLLVAASKEDTYSYESSQTLFEGSPSLKKEFKKYQGGGHGTNMLSRTDVRGVIINWLS